MREDDFCRSSLLISTGLIPRLNLRKMGLLTKWDGDVGRGTRDLGLGKVEREDVGTRGRETRKRWHSGTR